jgi:enterobacterial common antigen flippase
MTWLQSFKKAGAMVKLGLVMMWTGLMGSAVTYATAALITQEINVQAVGIYSAAFALSGMFVNFVLNAMGADYYPRLTAAADDHAKVNRLVNEQTEIGLLLALPGLLATMVLAPWIVQLFYTKEFLPAVELIQWFILGCLGRVISWPLGYVLIAQGKSSWLFGSELFMHSLHLVLIYIALSLYGAVGVAIAFAILYSIHVLLMRIILRNLMRFFWTKSVQKIVLTNVFVFGLTFLMVTNLDTHWYITTGVILILLAFILSWSGLRRRVERQTAQVPIFVLRFLNLNRP